MELITKTNFIFDKDQTVYHGKVRDVYSIGDMLIMIASDRISAFDVILPRAIAYKGQVLNQTATYFLNASKPLVPNWLIESPDPNVAIGYKCKPFKIEMVVRGYLAGHAWRTYQSGLRTLCGVALPEGLRENDRLPRPIITPTTKSNHGHDQDISADEIIRKQLATKQQYEQLEAYALNLFELGSRMAQQQGLLLVDTKYEFGILNNQILLMDEIHTPDSSRYFYKAGYEDRQSKGEIQEQLSKEFLRQWLIANEFQGLQGQTIPTMTDAVCNEVSARYIKLYQTITGQLLQPRDYTQWHTAIEANVMDALKRLS
ncbi:MAG: phosphoribosylaminoimidazolesuccinocarboxamide synthase [Bacteroidetes bacterium]|nr:phosphoribosylaminoimidazolesuccinocarboxamide synthase [Bacteroidota bacterium]